MAFNFSGMMQGLGQGLMNSSVLMNEQAKRDWEQQQLMLKLDREEHMERLRMQSQKELTGMQLSATAEQNRLTREQQASQFTQEYGLKEQELGLRAEDIRAANAARSQQLGIQQQELAMKREAYAAATPEAQRKERLKTAESLKELGIPDQAVGMFVATGQFPSLEKSGIKVDGSDIVAAQKQAAEEWNMMDEDQQEEATKTLGAKTPAEALKMFKANAVSDLLISTGKTPAPTGVMKSPTQSSVNFKTLREQALSGDSRAIAQIKSLAASPQYKDNKAIQATLKDIENKYRQTSSETDSPFQGFEPFSE